MPPHLVLANLHLADRSYVVAAMASFAGKPADQWLSSAHPFSKGQVAQRSWPALATVPNARFIEAVAVAGPNHCLDGWSYVSRALSALLAGDQHAARHLAYYAQLRAGLCLLANLGVGIFNGINFVVDATGTIQRLDTPGPPPRLLGLGTHLAVWQALDAWSANPVTARAFLDLIKVRGVPLRDSLEAIWPGSAGTGVAGELIKSWGVDLRRGKDEHSHRNISSYGAHALNLLSTTVSQTLQFIDDVWTAFEPTGVSTFDNVDRYLLRNVLQKQHRIVAGNSKYHTGSIVTRYANLPARVQNAAPLDFLTSKSDPKSPRLIRHAKQRTVPAEATEMIARAFLLLRAATAFTHASFVDAGLDLSGGALRPWVDELAAARGFWSSSDPLEDPVDLWADIEIAMIDFNASRDPTPLEWNEWMVRTSKGLPIIYEAERVGVWSLGA